MPDSAEQLIVNRLAAAPSIHPSGANLFVQDWTLEPGDIVTVQSGEESYQVPIYSMNLKWNGTSMLDIQSTGNQKRNPLSALNEKKTNEFRSGRRGLAFKQEIDEEFQEFETWKVETDETLETHAGQFAEIETDIEGVTDRVELAETTIGQTASDAYIIATATGILLDENGHPELDEQGHYQYDPDAGDTTLTARINTNATNILAKVSQQDLTTTLSSYLLIDAFGTELGTTLDSGGETLAAKIITAIDANTNTSEVRISADQINLDGYVTSSALDTRLLNADSLFTETGYADYIKAGSFITQSGGSVTGDTIYATSSLSIGTNTQGGSGTFYYRGTQFDSKNVTVGGTQVQNIKLMANLSGNLTAVALPDAIATIAVDDNPPAGKIGFKYTTIGNSTPVPINFKIADTQTYIDGVSAAYENGWTTAQGYVVLPTTQQTTNAYMDVTVPSSEVDGDPVPQRYTVSVDDDYAYIKTGNTIVAQVANSGSGTAYNTGYSDGQDNAFADIKSIGIDAGTASYSTQSSNLSMQITAVPQLTLISQDSTTTQTDGDSETVEQSLAVVVTDVTISDSSIVYNNNGTYTIGGSGGNVNIGAVNGVGGANIPVDTNAYPFTPTEALNDVNVVKGSWTGTTTKTIEFTTDAPNPVAGSSKSVSLTLNKGGWTWEAEDGGGGNYKTQVQVKDGNAGILTDYVDLPGLSLDIDTPQQQDSWWHQTGTYAYQYVVPKIGAVPYLSSDTSKQNPLGYYHSNNIVINPSQAIEHGKSLVSVTRTWTEYDGTPSGDTPLDPGKTYHLEVKKDSTTVYDELYTVPAQAAPTVNTWGLAHQTGTDYTYKASVNVNGTQYESGNLNAEEAYNNGWTGAYQSVGIFPTSVADLVPGGSPITIYAQAKATSGSAKSNVASVQVKARALNLKDETFTANDTYAVPEGYDGYGTVTVNVQGGGGSSDRRAVFLDNITLTAPANPEPGFNWQFTESSFAHYTDPVSVETDAAKKTQVTIDASAIYQAGVSAGSVGNVDIVKGAWSTNGVSQVATCEFTTSTGTGEPKSVTIQQSARENTSTVRGYVDVLDDQETISTAIFQMELASNGKSVELYHATNTVAMTLKRNRTQIATISVNGSETPTIEADVDDIVKNPTENVTYSENYKTAYIPVQALDENDNELLSKTISVSVEGAWNNGHAKGVEEGSGIKIEQEKEVTASQNNTTITVLPTYTASEQYDVMGSVKVNVQVPTYEGISSASIIDQSESEKITWQKELGTKTLSSQYGQIEVTGNDGSTKRLVVDASQVYQNGMNAGAGIQIENNKNYGTVSSSGSVTISPSDGYSAMRTATIYVNMPKLYGNYNAGTLPTGSGTINPPAGYDGMKSVSYSVAAVSHSLDVYRNASVYAAAGVGVRSAGSVNMSDLSAGKYIRFGIECGDNVQSLFYVKIN